MIFCMDLMIPACIGLHPLLPRHCETVRSQTHRVTSPVGVDGSELVKQGLHVHARNIEIETFENSDEMIFCMDLMSAALQPLLDRLYRFDC
jgi:hypothetical protein